MIASDVLLIAALLGFVVVWWVKASAKRDAALLILAIATIVIAAVAAYVDRWQALVGLIVGVVFLVALLARKFWRGARRNRPPYISGTLLILTAVAASLAPITFPVPALPPPTGQHPVGVRSFELVDRSRLGVLNAAKDQPRRLLVRVWYPAANTEGIEARPYFDAVEAKTTARSMGRLFSFEPFIAYMRHGRTNSFEKAPLLTDAADLPTVIYSHGYTAFLSQNTALMEDLASHGYVVYSVQHTGDSSATVFPNGEVVPMDPALIKMMAESPQARGEFPEAMVKGYTSSSFDDRLAGQLQQVREQIERGDRLVTSAPAWVADRLFVHDQLQQQAVPAEVADIVAASALERVGEIGMSFGGSTTGAVCLRDVRCAAGVNLDGGDLHFAAFAVDMLQPFLMFHADPRIFYRQLGVAANGAERSFNDFSYERFETAGRRADLYRMQVKDAAHLGFSDFSLFMRTPLRTPIIGSTPSDVMIGAQNDGVRGFFDKHLRGIDNDFPAGVYEKYRGWVTSYDNSAVREWWLSKSPQERAALDAEIAAVKAKLP
jgi:predicted dienelactone hydrolase